MALTTGTIFQVQASATTGNINGAGFNTANANFPTDLTATSATGNSPVLSSATYTFVAGDVGSWVYVKSGTNWTPGWYQIASVSAGAATVSAAIGQAIQINTYGIYLANTVAGVATTASPTAGTFGVDYSQQDTANLTLTDLASVGASTTLTSVTGGWSPVSVGNFVHITTTGVGAFFVVGWYEIVSYTNTTTVVTDRTTNTGTAGVGGTGQTGGAGRLNGLEDAFLEMVPAGAYIWIKNGSYTISGAISISSTNGTATNPVMLIGFNSLRGDACTGSNRPLFTLAANAVSFGQFQYLSNLIFTSTTAAGVTINAATIKNCKFLNSSTTASRVGLTLSGAGTDVLIYDCEAVSQNGTAMNIANPANQNVFGCYVHDSVTGISGSATGAQIGFCIVEACSTDGINVAANTSGLVLINNTIYGREAKMGTGLNLSNATSTRNKMINNIFYGLTTGITVNTTLQNSNLDFNNDYFNNTTDVTLWNKTASDIAVNPQFVDATQITGTTATTSGSVLTQSGGDFSTVTDNVDYLRVISGTGVTAGCYLITSHTSTTLTVNNALGTSSGGDVVYFVTTGHNFAVGVNLKYQAFPGSFQSGQTVGYLDTGAAQRQEVGTTSYSFVS